MRTAFTPLSILRQVLLAAGLFLLLAPGTARAEQRYTGVWESGSDGYYLWSGVDWNNFNEKWKELAKQNLRLIDIETYVEGGKRKYTGVWRSGSDGYYLWAGVDWNNFNDKWKELAKQNLRLIDIETYTEGGQRKYIGVWRSGSDGYYLWAGVDWNNFNAKWTELAKQNLRLIDIETYAEGGQRKYIGVWRSGSDGYYLWAGVDWNNFTAKWSELAKQNLRLIDIESYDEGGQRKYVGVWRSGTGGYYLWANVDWENFTAKWNELAKQNLRLIDIEVDPGNCGDGCSNQVVAKDSYNYGITRTATHCPGLPNTCGNPGANETVVYRWPVDVEGSNKYVRLSAVTFNAAPFTLPFSDTAVERRGIWLYSPGSWHHAGDYSRDDVKTFQVKAAAPGKVIHVGWDNWSGNTVIVSHDVGGVKDAFRTIYMHLRNGKANDCSNAWSKTVPTLKAGSQERTDYIQHLNDTGCKQDPAQRNLDESHWGKSSETIPNQLGQQVTAGQFLAWAGNTGPGGKRGAGGPNTHLHIFWARRDTTNNEWYFFDPYGIYGTPDCYPSDITGKIGGSCARYPNAWKGGKPQYP